MKYNYDNVKNYLNNFGYKLLTKEENYKDVKTVLDTICPNGHEWKVSFGNFIYGLRCSECKKIERKRIKLEMIKEFAKSEGYELLENEYINNSTNMKFKCPEGHEFYATWGNFKRGRRCSYCYKYRKMTYEEVYKFFYNEGYILLSKEYHSAHEKLKVLCPLGHPFDISYAKFYIGRRCNVCNMSSGEQKIYHKLSSMNIRFETQKIFKNCFDERYLPFDFYLPDYNCCIEFNGVQHYEQKAFQNTEKDFNKILYHDSIKRYFCMHNNIKLLIIPYWEFDNIDVILELLINQNKVQRLSLWC